MSTQLTTNEQKDQAAQPRIKRTTLGTIAILLLREQRLVSGIGVVHMSTQLGYTNSSGWTKVELGHSKLRINTLFEASQFLRLRPSQLLDQAEKISLLLVRKDWCILAESDLEGQQDDLFTLIKTHTKKGFTWNPEEYGHFPMPSFAIQAIEA